MTTQVLNYGRSASSSRFRTRVAYTLPFVPLPIGFWIIASWCCDPLAKFEIGEIAAFASAFALVAAATVIAVRYTPREQLHWVGMFSLLFWLSFFLIPLSDLLLALWGR